MRKRILFVEDNPILLSLYAMMLEGESERWEVATAPAGRQALEWLEQHPCDVIVSDLRMPGMDGLEFFAEVQQRYPHTSRVIISGLQDQQEVARCLNSTHQFLAKPFQAKALKATLARIGSLDVYLQEERLRALVGRLNALPSFPSLYLEVTQELNRPEPAIETLAKLIAKDPSMTAKILQLVNSAALGLAVQVATPFEAVQLLGLQMIRSLVLSAHVFSSFQGVQWSGFSTAQLWAHSMRTGALARLLMQREGADAAEAEEAAIAGMLHDVGQLMLAQALPEQFQTALTLTRERNLSLAEAEQEIFGATHAGVAAYLLGLWGLPAGIVEAVAFHHTPSRSETRLFGPLAAVHVANGLEHALGAPCQGELSKELDLNYLTALGLQDRLEAWRATATKALASPQDL